MSGSHRLCARVLVAAFALCLLAPVGSAFAQAADATVTLVDTSFDPMVLHVAPGTRVVWTNASSAAHTVTSDDGLFDSAVDPNSIISAKLDTPGTFQYFCQYHGAAGLVGMAATIIVDDH